MPDDKVAVQNVNQPGTTTRVDAAKYTAMKDAMLATLTRDAPGMTATEMNDAAKPHLPDNLFPAGATAGWWLKCVQLDQEAKGVVARSATKPLISTAKCCKLRLVWTWRPARSANMA